MSPQDGYFLFCGVVLALFSHVSGGTAVGQGIYRIVNVYTGLDLEVNGASLADGGTVDQWSDVSGANNEHWNLMAVGDGTYRIVNVNSGLDLEDNVGHGKRQRSRPVAG